MLVVPQTEVRLLNNVPLTNSYEHQMTFTNKTAQASYFTGKTAHSFTDFTYVKEDGTVKVPRGRDSLYSCNYIMFKNTDFSSKWFYGFITKLEYINPTTTKVHFELDVYQTWQFDFSFKASYVEREHCKRWNADGSPVINTVDEGLDYGSEYETVKVENVIPYEPVYFLVIVTKSAMHYSGGTSYVNKILPTANGLPQPLNYYVHPFKMNGNSPTVKVGTTNISINPILEVLESLFTQEGAVNNVVSLYVTEYFGQNVSYDSASDTLTFNANQYERASVSDDSSLNLNTIHVKGIMEYNVISKTLGNKYDGFNSVDESKLLMYPYTVTVLDDFKGNRVEIKNEYIKGSELSISIKGSLGTSNKVAYNVNNYLFKNGVSSEVVELEKGLINNSPNDLPILAEMLSAYLQGNRNTLENQKSSIMFNAVTSALGSAFGGAMFGGGKMGVLGGVGGATVGAVNSYYQIEGLNAKKRDIQNTPPQMVKMGGNTAFDYGNDIKGLFVVKKQITAEYRKKLTDFFKMYGYKVNELKVPNLKSRAHFNYIKTVGANLTGNVPQEDLSLIKRMFDQGVTLWHTTDVGNYALTNGEV